MVIVFNWQNKLAVWYGLADSCITDGGMILQYSDGIEKLIDKDVISYRTNTQISGSNEAEAAYTFIL